MELNSLIYSKLKNDTTLTALLDTLGSDPAIFYANLLPTSFTGDESINFYLVQPKDGHMPYIKEDYSLSCRSASKATSQAIALRAAFTLNRHSPDSDSFCFCRILPTIPPEDETDNYNTPVECRITKRTTGGF